MCYVVGAFFSFFSMHFLGTPELLASPASGLEHKQPEENSGAHRHVVAWVLSFPASLSPPDLSEASHVCFLYNVESFCLLEE